VPTYRLDLAYDGSGFHGYARQPGMRTVQGVLEDALFLHTGPVETVVAGRTDARVHARHQVVSFDSDRNLHLDRVAKSLNAMLGGEVVVHSLRVAPPGFNARFSATARAYRYRVADAPVPDPLARHLQWHVRGPLDEAAMGEAAACFVGEHDFASLCLRAPDKTTVRTVHHAAWNRSGAVLEFDVAGKAFCHHMVRSMVALSVEAGRGRLAAESIAGILDAKDRNAARGAAPAHGLVLWEVSYGS
jgi:tRNA pseudouridine38-40 synthase